MYPSLVCEWNTEYDLNVDAEIDCGTCECDLKDWSFKYFSLPRINYPYGVEF